MTYPKRRSTASRLVLAATLSLAIPGCARVLPPSQHAAAAAHGVRIYQDPPAEYEVLGVVSLPVTDDMRKDEWGESEAGIDALLAKAAALGANGVLLVGEPGSPDLTVVVGYRGSSYRVPYTREPKQAVARAIRVIAE